MDLTSLDILRLITTSNFADRFEVDLSLARTAEPLGLVLPAETKSNGLLVISKGTGIFTMTFKFPIAGTTIGKNEVYFLSSEITDQSRFPYEFIDLIFTNEAQPGVENPVFSWNYNVYG